MSKLSEFYWREFHRNDQGAATLRYTRKLLEYLDERWEQLDRFYTWRRSYEWQIHDHLIGYNDQVVQG